MKAKWLCLAGLVFFAQAAMASPLLEGPWEIRVSAAIDPDNSDEESAAGGTLQIGYWLDDSISVGVYGNLYTSDRDLPVRMRRMQEAGVLAEYGMASGNAVGPFLGLRAGVIDPSGPASDTIFTVAGVVGLKYSVSDFVSVSCAAVMHWADEEIFDYERSGDTYNCEDTDLTVEIGIGVKY